MSSNLNIFMNMNCIKELEVFHEGFAGLIRIAKQQGSTPERSKAINTTKV